MVLIVGGLCLATILTGGSIMAVSGLVGASIGGISGGIQTRLMGGKFIDGVTSGIINGAVTSLGMSFGINPVASNMVGGILDGASQAIMERGK